ncbi:phosphatase PAP2 family protein [Actinoplanes missouriensis]|uniref:phosphatase PAP2 family protein n=1 Tax=Actinoplanes missouriensis TaxID=1866 RepID=UPI0033FD2FB3
MTEQAVEPRRAVVHRPAVARSGILSALRELSLVAALFMVYKVGRLAADGHVDEAFRNARAVWDVERWLHLPSELTVQRALLDWHALVEVANSYYAYVHFPATAAALIWLYLYRPAHYRWTRNVLTLLTGSALLVHFVIPLAPPRMLGETGMLDLGHLFGPAVYGNPETDHLSNQYAAMPSLHFGWALVVAVALMAAIGGRRRALWLLHPAITLLVIVATGNHYWLDAVAGGLLTAAAYALLSRHRPAVTPVPPVTRDPRAFIPAPRRPAGDHHGAVGEQVTDEQVTDKQVTGEQGDPGHGGEGHSDHEHRDEEPGRPAGVAYAGRHEARLAGLQQRPRSRWHTDR